MNQLTVPLPTTYCTTCSRTVWGRSCPCDRLSDLRGDSGEYNEEGSDE